MLKDLSKTYNEDQTQLVTQDIDIQLPMSKPEYKSMLANIKDHAPAIRQASSNFYKSHSQMMSVTLDVTAITPLRQTSSQKKDSTTMTMLFNNIEFF